MKKAPVRELRVTFGQRHGCSGFQLHTSVAPLERQDALFAHRLHQALIHSSYAVLARRIEAGWEPPYESLFGTGPHM
jgi:hypothetical protein